MCDKGGTERDGKGSEGMRATDETGREAAIAIAFTLMSFTSAYTPRYSADGSVFGMPTSSSTEHGSLTTRSSGETVSDVDTGLLANNADDDDEEDDEEAGATAGDGREGGR